MKRKGFALLMASAHILMLHMEYVTLKYIIVLVLYSYVKYMDVLNAVVIGRDRREDGLHMQWGSHLCFVRKKGMKI